MINAMTTTTTAANKRHLMTKSVSMMMSMQVTLSALVFGVVLFQVLATPQVVQTLKLSLAERSQSAGDPKDPERLAEWEAFKNSKLYLPPFESDVLFVPRQQVEFVRQMTTRDIKLFKEILHDAIEGRNRLFPSVALLAKHLGNLIRTFINNRREEKKLKHRIDPQPAFFTMIADMIDDIVERSDEIKKKKKYGRRDFQPEVFRRRVTDIFDYFKRIIDASPLGAYHKWTQLLLFSDKPQDPRYRADVIEEGGDLFAQFRGAGYEATRTAARQIVNLLRTFGKNQVPNSEKEVMQ